MPRKKTQREFLEQARQVHGSRYEFANTVYVNDSSKLLVTCKEHGDFNPTASNFLQGSGCPKCAFVNSSLRLRKSQAQFIDDASRVHGNRYDYSKVTYKNNSTPVVITCTDHGDFVQRPNVHTDQHGGCPKCKSSKGEAAVRNWLQTLNVVFSEQHSFPDCRHKRVLKFDFFVPSHNMLIEFNGIQHYRPVPLYNYSKDTFEVVKERDAIKIAYAKSKGLHLIVVPYNVKADAYLNEHAFPLLSV